jgi:predicted AAA+ superfamily ATPase
LVAAGQTGLFYWRSAGGRAELDFLYEIDRKVVPVEVKAGLSRTSKSLRSYDEQFAPDVLVRANLLNLKRDGKICNVPLYAVSVIRQLL